jgi:hypothetical protein
VPCRTVNRLSATDAAYIAGLIEGEGTVALSRKHARDRRQLVLSISSTEPALLRWVLECVGAGKITRKRVASDRHAPGSTYAIANRQALLLLEQTAPNLRTYKRLRAEMVLANYLRLTPWNGKYTDPVATERTGFEIAFLALRANAK